MQTVFRVDMRKAKESKDGLLMCCLAMAVNDLIAANTFLMLTRKQEMDSDVRIGLEMHAIRLQIAHLSSALELLNQGDNYARIEKYIPQLSYKGRQAFA